MDKKRGLKIFLIILAVLVLVLAIYFTFFFYSTCSDSNCYYSHLAKCSRTNFEREDSSAKWIYKITGSENNKCSVEVSVVQIKLGDIQNTILEGKSMTCLVEKNLLVFPDSDLLKCSGKLKEELQSLIIQKLHSYILENVGEIKQGLSKPL
jgi:hypothetical protein